MAKYVFFLHSVNAFFINSLIETIFHKPPFFLGAIIGDFPLICTLLINGEQYSIK